MKPRSYIGMVGAVLKPAGFERKGQDFTRIRDGLLDCVNLQVSQFAGITANIHMMDLVSEALLIEAAGLKKGPVYPVNVRIGRLIDGHNKGLDRWWHRDSKGPAEMSEAIENYALPFFDQMHPLEAQARYFGRESAGWSPSLRWLAITLYRLGEKEEACQRLQVKLPRYIKEKEPEYEAMRRWLGCEPNLGGEAA